MCARSSADNPLGRTLRGKSGLSGYRDALENRFYGYVGIPSTAFMVECTGI